MPRPWRWVALGMVAILLLGLVSVVPRIASQLQAGAAAPPDRSVVRIVAGAPQTWDPARQGDAGTAAILAQVFEGLTSFDPSLHPRPALAGGWQLDPSGLSLTFDLRSGITYSDGTPIAAQDVVDSWLRLLDPAHPSPMASLLDDVAGAAAYRQGQANLDAVGLRATGDQVIVRFRHPASYFVSIAASPSLAVVPPSMVSQLDSASPPSPFVGSGGYTVEGEDATSITLRANPHYWAGTPAIATVSVVTDLGQSGPVDVFAANQVDYVPIGIFDAQWVRYDRDLGPQLRQVTSLSVDYYGFNTRQAPFNDVRVRRAFALAVDWQRLVALAGDGSTAATSLLPPGLPGRSDTDYVSAYDPAAARAELAAAGFPGGRGLAPVTLVTSGSAYDDAVVGELRSVLGVDVSLEVMPFDEFQARLSEPTGPAFWALSWIADYPAPEDFLGLLLGTGSTSNSGGWSDRTFDAALEAAGRSTDPAEQAAQYDAAQSRVRDQMPVIPVSYTGGWALSRDGLLGATDPGDGIIRFAGLAWSQP